MKTVDSIYNVDYKYLFGAADQVPDLTNEYTGSLPPKNGTKGVFADYFRYRVWLRMDGEDPDKIVAAWYFGANAYEHTYKGNVTEKEFEPSEEGAAEAVAWLKAAYENA